MSRRKKYASNQFVGLAIDQSTSMDCYNNCSSASNHTGITNLSFCNVMETMFYDHQFFATTCHLWPEFIAPIQAFILELTCCLWPRSLETMGGHKNTCSVPKKNSA